MGVVTARQFIKLTAGSTPVQSLSRAVANSVFKQPLSHRASISSSITDQEDLPKSSGAARQTWFASDALNKCTGLHKLLTRLRISMPTPTPGNGVSHYPSLSHTKNPSIPSAVGHQPIGAPTINGG